jgi:hypothetical protein
MDPGWVKIGIRDKHPGSATLLCTRRKEGSQEDSECWLWSRTFAIDIFFPLKMPFCEKHQGTKKTLLAKKKLAHSFSLKSDICQPCP